MHLLHAIVPLQLSFGAVGEVAAGYDSTAVDPRTGRYVAAPLLRPAVDLQILHEGVRVRQFLRNRGEAWFEGTGGRDFLDADFFNQTRYALVWQPSETTALHTDASYTIGAPALIFSRAGRADLSFARRGLQYRRALVADYSLRQDIVHSFTPTDALQLEAAVAGRYPLTSQPRGQNMFTPYATIQWTHEFNEDNNGMLGVRGEHLALELFRPVWAVSAYAGWGRNWGEDTSTLLQLGGTVVQTNVGEDRWDVQPYGRVSITRRFPRQRLVLNAGYTRTFGVVSATLGTGALDIANITAYFRPGNERVIYYADASFQHGEGFNPTANRPVTSTFGTFGAGVRWNLARDRVRLFARYDFQWEHNSTYEETGTPDFVRHLVMAGVQFAWGTNEEALAGMVPVEEIQVIDQIRGEGGRTGAWLPSAPDPLGDPRDRPRRQHLPGDPPDDEIERTNRDRASQQPGDGPLPGETERLPGDGDLPETSDPLRGGDEPRGEQPR